MAEQENVQAAKDAYAAFGRGDIAAIMQAIADDIEWVEPGPPEIPYAGTFHGKQAVQAWFGTLGESVEFYRFEPHEFIAQGDKVVVLIRVEVIMRRTNKRVTNEIAQVSTYRDGKVVRFQSFADTAATVAALRGE